MIGLIIRLLSAPFVHVEVIDDSSSSVCTVLAKIQFIPVLFVTIQRRVAGDRLLLEKCECSKNFAQFAPRTGNLIASGGKLSAAVSSTAHTISDNMSPATHH